MKMIKEVLTIALLGFADAQKSIKLKNVDVLTLYAGRMTTGRRSAPVPQLQVSTQVDDCPLFIDLVHGRLSRLLCIRSISCSMLQSRYRRSGHSVGVQSRHGNEIQIRTDPGHLRRVWLSWRSIRSRWQLRIGVHYRSSRIKQQLFVKYRWDELLE